MSLELEIYDHILELIKNAEDLWELKKWVTQVRDELKIKISFYLNLLL